MFSFFVEAYRFKCYHFDIRQLQIYDTKSIIGFVYEKSFLVGSTLICQLQINVI